jgi:hypothetical protein
MDPRPGCLPLLLVLILGIGALFVGVSSDVSVETTPAPAFREPEPALPSATPVP